MYTPPAHEYNASGQTQDAASRFLGASLYRHAHIVIDQRPILPNRRHLFPVPRLDGVDMLAHGKAHEPFGDDATYRREPTRLPVEEEACERAGEVVPFVSPRRVSERSA